MPVSDIYEFCVSVIDATADAAAAFKPNLAFFEALGAPGFVSMKRVVEYIHNKYPGKIVIGDGKISGGTLNYFWTLGVASFRKRNGATKISLENAGERARGAVAASDGFFPFRDSVDLLGKAGVQAIIQPGGSINDKKVIEAANKASIVMLLTRIRHFKH